MKRSTNRFLLVLGLLTALLGGLTAGSATAADGDAYRIINYQTGGTMKPYGNSKANGKQIWTYNPRHGQGFDYWKFDTLGDGSKLIRNTATGKCLKPGRGTRVVRLEQDTCRHTLEFKWQLTPTGNRTHKIVSMSSHHVLAPQRNREHTRVVLEEDTNALKHQWSLNRRL